MITKKSGAVWRTVLIVIISLVIGLTAYNWNAKRLVGNSMPMPFGYGASVILSGSMEPVLSVNDLVVLKECDEYELNDVVVYQSGDMLVIHRIIEIGDGVVTTKGDANNVADDPIAISDIKGKLIFKLPFIGVLVRAIKTPVGIVCILGAAVVLLELSYRREKQDDMQKLEDIKREIRRLRGEASDSSSDEDNL